MNEEKKVCYMCMKAIENVKYIEFIPLFFRYVCVCEECHIKHNMGDTIENIKKYEEFLGKLGFGNFFKS